MNLPRHKQQLFAVITLCITLLTSFVSLGNEEAFGEQINLISELRKSDPELALTQIEALKQQAKLSSTHNQISYYNLSAEILIDLGLYQKSKQAAELGLTLARDVNSPTILSSELFYNLGFANEKLGDIELAERHYSEGLEIAKSLEQQKQIAMGLANLGAVYYQTSQGDRSIVALQDALTISKMVKDDELSGLIYSEFGILYGELGEFDKAITFYQKSYDHFIKIKSYISAYNNMRNLGINYSNIGNYEESINAYQTIIENQSKIKNTEIILSAYSGLAWAYAKKEGDEGDEQAYQYLLEAGLLIDSIEASFTKLNYLINTAWALDALKRYDDALDTLQKAEELLQNNNYSRSLASALRVKSLKALIYYDLGIFQGAYDLLEEYSQLEIQFRNSKQNEKVSELRVAYESNQADIENQILESQAKIESIELAKANRTAKAKSIYITISALLALLFGWLLYRIYLAQKGLILATRTDPLTGLYNRRYLFDLAERFFGHAKSSNNAFSLLIIDCDHFKSVNDQYGHQVGDTVLTTIARLGNELITEPNRFGRIGGEEFMLLMPNADIRTSSLLAESIRETVEQQVWLDLDMTVSVSIGVASYAAARHNTLHDLMKAADEKLYQAKNNGRNTICA